MLRYKKNKPSLRITYANKREDFIEIVLSLKYSGTCRLCNIEIKVI